MLWGVVSCLPCDISWLPSAILHSTQSRPSSLHGPWGRVDCHCAAPNCIQSTPTHTHTRNPLSCAAEGDLPRKADIVVHEILDTELIGEGVLPTMRDAYARLLKPGARSVPMGATVYAQVCLMCFGWCREGHFRSHYVQTMFRSSASPAWSCALRIILVDSGCNDMRSLYCLETLACVAPLWYALSCASVLCLFLLQY